MSCFLVMFDREGEERRARGGAQLEDGLVVVRIETPTTARRKRGVFNPELEATIGANRGDEVGVDGRRKPLDLRGGVRLGIERLVEEDELVRSQLCVRPRCR